MLFDQLPAPLRRHDETAAVTGQRGPKVANHAVILRALPTVPTLVLNGQDRAARQLAEEVRVEAPIRLLQEERAALPSHEVAHPEADPPFLRLGIQPASTLEFLTAVEVAQAAVVVLSEVEVTESPIIVAAGSISVRVELKHIEVADRHMLSLVPAKQRLLEARTHSRCLQAADLSLDEVAEYEFLQIRAS